MTLAQSAGTACVVELLFDGCIRVLSGQIFTQLFAAAISGRKLYVCVEKAGEL
jgi:hypothetical protein